MEQKLFIYNTITRKKEEFTPLNPPFVGIYVCGPTVYGEPHLGHARPAITFDVLYRYLVYRGNKVRYVRNITDVGHLEDDTEQGEDKIEKKARLEQLEPMEVVQFYTDSYHASMDKLNVHKPSIEPRASGHIIEQLQLIDKIYENGFAYEVNGSVYFDVEAYSKKYHYGKLSGRVLDDLYANTRELDGQSEKKNSFDFALWKKAMPEHIMRWPSRWSEGFPGWHLECSVMSTKYLGEEFDIHGGGMDLIFPHHECEIAQSIAASGKEAVHYWIHNNMITINGQKMGKSLGNFITLNELFSGKHAVLTKAYSPMTVRFFILQAHYRSTLDFSNEALNAAEKGFERLIEAYNNIDKIKPSETSTININNLQTKCIDALNDDLNTPVVIASLFEAVKNINAALNGSEKFDKESIIACKKIFNDFIFNVLGFIPETSSHVNKLLSDLVELLLNERMQAKKRKDFEASDHIRSKLVSLGIEIKDTKDGFEWKLKN
ncbi:MAG: cysteine--tRNA ligase [Bacteroidetes bacterium CG23_combo_of_CG06-09_8_20_14_all_32_9]|nr:MAG: cysteine--tRNA ligase [Bacteroidetes bacterium CG23_combo_of_CG06-09_8_20_14_all_32_9]